MARIFPAGHDVPIFDEWLRKNGLNGLPLIAQQSDICRPELLFEIELDAVVARQSRNPPKIRARTVSTAFNPVRAEADATDIICPKVFGT